MCFKIFYNIFFTLKKMIYYTVIKFVSEISALYPDVDNIIVSYMTKECVNDKFEKNTVFPLLIILETDNKEKIKLDYDKICEQFTETIALTLPHETIAKLGVALCSISTSPKYSKKFEQEYYEKKFIYPGTKLINEVNEIYKKKELEKASVYDL